MERMRMAGLTQQDEKLQFPIFCMLSKEVWKSKEAGLPDNEAMMGYAKKRGIMMEAISAIALLLAGGDVVMMRHPEAIKLVKEMLADLTA
jgi:acetyl-CoA decarbonylase/synthase complex subunit delta